MADHADLLASIATLQATVDELRQHIDTTRAGRFRSMRESRRCPACGGGRLLHVHAPKEVGYGGPVAQAISHVYSTWKDPKPCGAIELFVCRACHLIEHYVIDFEGVTIDGEQISAIEPEPELPGAGPFR